MPIIDARHYKAPLDQPEQEHHGRDQSFTRARPSAGADPRRKRLPQSPPTGGPLRTLEPKLCFLDFSTEQQAYSVLSESAFAQPHRCLFWRCLAADNPDLVLQCLRQGATDFLIRPFTTDQLDACISKVARIIPAATRNVGGAE